MTDQMRQLHSNILKPESSKFQLPLRFVDSQNRNTQFRDVSSASSLQRIRLRHESGKLRPDIKHRVRASSNDAQFSLFSEENKVQASSFTKFITSEQVKVVTMLALGLALCNANSVVMSVAIITHLDNSAGKAPECDDSQILSPANTTSTSGKQEEDKFPYNISIIVLLCVVCYLPKERK
ncbi:hypothetical protein ACFX15_043095 [Malus domestica]